MLDNRAINYFIAFAIKQIMPSTSSLVQYANTMIGLMTVGSGPPRTTLINGQYPLLYAKGLFVRAFYRSYFMCHFDWLLRRDPEFGHNSHGQTIWLYPERCYLAQRDLDELRTNDGWNKDPEFKEYIEAIVTMPDLGMKENADRSFFCWRT